MLGILLAIKYVLFDSWIDEEVHREAEAKASKVPVSSANDGEKSVDVQVSSEDKDSGMNTSGLFSLSNMIVNLNNLESDQ